ncbi:Leucine aminopeptidase 1 [Chytriomyces hyalinus]|nr:Leucine aminopeptidase 1 [Chytriomyces hyalinus]
MRQTLVNLTLLLTALVPSSLAAPSRSAQMPLLADINDAMQWKQNGFRLISTSESEPPTWRHFGQILELYQSHTKFIDVTDQDLEGVSMMAAPTRFAIPSKPRHNAVVAPYLGNVSIPHMEKWLTEFTSFKTRYYQSQTGKDSAEWLFAQATKVAALADSSKVKITISKFEHEWAQFSIIVRVEDAEDDLTGPIVVVSAHQDSTNQWNPWWGAAPGADDDGSGSCTIFEAYRVLVEGGFVPIRPVEFHWYAGEEGGLLGSQKVVADYKKRQVDVVGVFHADMTGYTPDDPSLEVIGVSTDNVDGELESFVKQLTLTHNEGTKLINTECGYGCSDHATWTKAGYPAAFLFEASFKQSSPYVHSVNDVVEHITFTHVEKFTRVAIAFAVELSYSD